MMANFVEPSQNYKDCCTDFFVKMHQGVASVQHVDFSNSKHGLFDLWCSQVEKVFLNQYCEAQIPSIISTLLDGVESCVVVFQVGPSFSFQFNTTATEEGWLRLINSSGLNIIATEYIEIDLDYVDKRYDLIASHWNNIDPYRDRKCISKPKFFAVKLSHKNQATSVIEHLNEDVNDGLMNFLLTKKKPSLFYIIHFFQDLAFLRGLAARVGSDNVYVIVNDGNLAIHHLIVVKKFLNNHAFDNSYLRDFDMNKMNAGDMLLTSTLGPLSPMHLSCSRLIVKARELQVVTFTLQHGITLPDVFTTVTEYTLAWSEMAAKEIMVRSHSVIRSRVLSAGNVRPTLKSSPSFLGKKFGNWVSHFTRRVMIATNLHWSGTHGVSSDDVNAFITNMGKKNPDTLFFIRPHPEDYSLRVEEGASNILLVDDIVTGLLDLSIDDILVNCDFLFSTYSTLLYDAARHEVPFVVFDYIEEVARDSHLYPELPCLNIKKICKLSEIDDFHFDLKNQNFNALSTDNDKFIEAVLICANLGGHPIDDEQFTVLSEISEQYAIIAPDYGRSAYKSRLEDAFMVGLK
ncbi:hypothetical protein [Aeromonas dhakensis]|uniref:hypothetical protein n=2 Tax=Aeromonas dhakensis TaxID=196024 RepID=UPI003BA08B64